jgi:hypothetical protein
MHLKASWSVVFLFLALFLFGFAAWASAWAAPQNYWHGRLIAAGLFFATLSFLVNS